MISKLISGNLYYWCEGCWRAHSVPINRWQYSGTEDNPTISPSVRHYYTNPENNQETTICHYFIRNGNIEYCNDCEHKLKGQTLKLIDIPDDYGLPT